MAAKLEVIRLEAGSDLTSVRALIQGLRDHLVTNGVPIEEFQSLEEEIAGLPGKYGEDRRGCILVARLVDATTSSADGLVPKIYDADQLALISSDRTNERPSLGVVGCVAIKDISSPEPYAGAVDLRNTCEMKRLFVLPAARGHKAGETLCRALIEVGSKDKGYSCMKLDSLDRLPEACRIYEKLGFERCEPYVHNPMPDARYYSLDLTK